MTDPKEVTTLAGIYMLKHDATGDTYVGSAGNIRARFKTHLSELKAGRHLNKGMQALADRHGVCFSCRPLRFTDKSERFPLEREFIKNLKPTLNRGMPPESGGDKEVGNPANLKLLGSIVNRMKAFQRSHPLKPTLTQIIEAAVTDWLDRHEADHSKQPPAGRK